jgi:formylglycine-generating enzyme required for sulfatase activity
MRGKAYTLLVLLAMLPGMAGCGEKIDPTPPVLAPPDLADITLVPYTSQELGISGVVPAGWVEVKPGHFQPSPGTDPTLLGQVAFPGVPLERIAAASRFPESAGCMETADLTWELYQDELQWPDAGTLAWDVALAEDKAGTYLVTLVTPASEGETLYETVFLPAIGALAPAAGSEERAIAIPATPLPAGPTPIDTRLRPADGMVMVYVPAGEFEMGNPGTQWIWKGSLVDGDLGLQVFTDEGPRHTVYLDAFWIDKTEVTVAMFRSFVQATGYETTAERQGWGNPWTEGPMEAEWLPVPGADWRHPHGPQSSAEEDHPVTQVSWDDAAAYCVWAGGGLPTEAQWEKAARGTDRRAWPWGDAYQGTRGNFCEASCPIARWRDDAYDDGYALTAPVGSFPGGASPCGALDMAGNLWEWVADWYHAEYYRDSPPQNPLGPDSGTVRAMRGGAWYDNEQWVRCTVRHQNPPSSRCDDVGFRCAVPAEGGIP